MAAMVRVWWDAGSNNRGHKKGPDLGYIQRQSLQDMVTDWIMEKKKGSKVMA